MSKRTLTKLAASLALVAVAASTHAAPVTTWNYDITLSWGTGSNGGAVPTFTSAGGLQLANDIVINWGAPGSVTNPASNTGRSGLEIDNTNSSGSIASDGAAVTTNAITHYNNPLSASYGTLSTATIVADVKLYDPGATPGSAAVVDFINPFEIYFIETTNATPCLPGSATTCDDVFVITMGALNHSFSYEGYTYYASIFEATTALKPLPASACAQAGSSSPCIGFMTPENTHTTAEFAFTITSKPINIPEPGVLALLGIGLFAAGALRRRQH